MDFSDIEARGLVLLGCGKMGSALLAGWLHRGLDPSSVHVLDPHPSDWLNRQGVRLNADIVEPPAIVLIAVKPQLMQAALPWVGEFGNGATLFISIAAGTTLAVLEDALGVKTPIIRTMPNTPAAAGKGITALIGNTYVTPAQMMLAEGLMSAVGQTVRLEAEAQMDAVTALSGSGPAYVFHLIECMAAAGEAEGLAPALALQLAKATVAGAGYLAEHSEEAPAQLRENVTSPNGTTAAALSVLMNDDAGLASLMRRAIRAAALRSQELSQ
jgi:pyrroline-5-carboxylate reductase